MKIKKNINSSSKYLGNSRTPSHDKYMDVKLGLIDRLIDKLIE